MLTGNAKAILRRRRQARSLKVGPEQKQHKLADRAR